MIADEIKIIERPPELTDNEGETINHIKLSIINAIIPFKKSLIGLRNNKKFNENEMTEMFTQCVEYQIRRICDNISVNNQYYDIFFRTKGVPDFYFFICEETIEHPPLYVVEAKRLPSPGKKLRKREYVIGGKNNGGIERYKSEKHGKGFCKSGMLGFVEKKTFLYWHETINSWIKDIAQVDNIWKDDEILNMANQNDHYCELYSVAHRNSGDTDIALCHWWIKCENV
jgi:hypothetical protein